uniref:Uncharacterized protein n=1 Tax=Molossus molossus TaxID=27622 RepID=A0A7J8C8A3_MOLMO|nr:hypothetical protein HJG59_009839 [Molossus molossus]
MVITTKILLIFFVIFSLKLHVYVYTGWGKSRFTVCKINNARINSVLHTYNCKPTFPPLCIVKHQILYAQKIYKHVHSNFVFKKLDSLLLLCNVLLYFEHFSVTVNFLYLFKLPFRRIVAMCPHPAQHFTSLDFY